MIPYPAYRQAVHDRRTRKRDLMVLDVMADLLDVEVFRFCSRALIAERVGIDKSHVNRAIWRLRRLGYLDVEAARATDPKAPRFRYRLVLERGQRLPGAPSQAA